MTARGRSAARLAVGLCALGLLAAGAARAAGARRVLVLGVDGLDPALIEQFVQEGALPNFERMIATGDFKPLATSMPPLSPIAWATFVTGMDPGGHGIFDFIHRDPDTLAPYLSMADTSPPEQARTVRVGSRCIPVQDFLPGWARDDPGRNLRKGTPFWQVLERAGVPTTVFRMPVNFPPESDGHSFSGMGTPDIQGTPGTSSYYADREPANARSFTGQDFYPVRVVDGRVEAELCGPKDPYYCKENPAPRQRRSCSQNELAAPFTVHVDPEAAAARFVVGDHEFILKEGEWSAWVPVDFEVLPLLGSVRAIGRFYLKQVHPDFQLYVSPLQIDPGDPAMPLSTPPGWSRQLDRELGPFYTQSLPEDTKAFSNGVLTGREFWEQGQIVFRERRAALDYFLENFHEGLLFFYFSSVDQNCHMLWQYMDPRHPNFHEDEFLMNGIRNIYREIDESLGRVLEAIDDETTLVVMSDHGFAPFYWGLNLNTWLLQQGFVTLRDPAAQGRSVLFANVDWSRTRAYAVGLNGLYVNLIGRERRGIVTPGAEYEALLDELERGLLDLRDPRNGNQVVTLVTRTRRDFHGPYIDIGPDLIVGYNRGYRSSWKSPLGEFPKPLFVENMDAWSGDHAMDARLVPGVLISNRRVTLEQPALYDLTVAILDEYGVAKLPEMIGEDCLGQPTGAAGAAGPRP